MDRLDRKPKLQLRSLRLNDDLGMRVIQLRNILMGAAAVWSLASFAHAQASASQPTTASVTIFRPITLTKNADLSFGVVVRPLSGSDTVYIDKDNGARTLANNNAALLTTAGNPVQAPAGRAVFTVNGEGGQTFSITVPANFNMTRVGGSETITVVLTPSATTGLLSNTLGNAGTATFGVGGEIPVSSSTASGAYNGTFTTTVAYN